MLEHFFGSKTRIKLLQIFFRSPGQAFYVRELSRLAEIQLNGVRREIANLEKLGIVTRVSGEHAHTREIGTERSKYYQVQSSSLLFPELQALLVKAQLLEDRALVSALKQKSGTLKLFMLTGYFTQESEVDTDILLVGTIKPQVVAKLLRDYEREVQQSIRYTIMTEEEFRERRTIGDKFLYGIFEAKHTTAVDEFGLN